MTDVAKYGAAARRRLGQRVRRRRTDLGLTQQQLADMAELGVNTIASIENGNPARELNLARLNRALGWEEGSWVIVLEGGEPIISEPGETAEPAIDPMDGIERPPGLTDEAWVALRDKFMADIEFWRRFGG